jgi:hypothetical protein
VERDLVDAMTEPVERLEHGFAAVGEHAVLARLGRPAELAQVLQ